MSIAKAMSLPRIEMSMSVLVVICSVYFGTVLNFPVLYRVFQLSAGVSNPLFAYSSPVLLTCAFIIIFSAFAWPYFFKPFMAFLFISSAAALYAQINFQTVFDMSMMESIFETNSSEVLFYLNSSTLLYLFCFGILPSAFMFMVRVKPHRTLLRAIASRFAIVVLACIGIGLIGVTSYKDYASVGRNNHDLNKMIIPAHVFNSVRYLKQTYFTQPIAFKSQGTDAKIKPNPNGKPTLMVVVLGETARAMNFAYNGYQRNTNPYTQGMGLISFQNVSSCGTYTALSVPCMFSNLTRRDYDKKRAYAQDNVFDVIKHAGVDVLWIDNDGGDKGVARRLAQTSLDTSLKNEDCNGNTCFDLAMLQQAQQFISNKTSDKLLVLHTIGSHGPTYWQRYPDQMAPFQPACNRSDIENCSDSEIVNVYDNTLVYTDYVLAQTINQLKAVSDDYNVMLTYISDHGESLGESGLYLHGAPYAVAPKEQTQVPWLLWIPEQYAQQKQLNLQCIEDEAESAAISHDNVFDSLLGLYGISTSLHDTRLDITSGCAANS
jgi:lipid A ethanolaminephosphotransferase